MSVWAIAHCEFDARSDSYLGGHISEMHTVSVWIAVGGVVQKSHQDCQIHQSLVRFRLSGYR